MKLHTLVVMFSVTLLAIFIAGCATLAEPKWSENYAIKGESNVEQFIDGSMLTTGLTQPAEYVKGEKIDDSRYTDAMVTLKSPQEIKRVNIRRRSEDAVPVDLNLYAMMDGKWQLIREFRGEAKAEIDMKINTIKTDKIKVRVQRSTRSATAGKSSAPAGGAGGAATGRATRRPGGGGDTAAAERALREPLKIAEIEIYGIQRAEEQPKSEQPKAGK